MPDSVLIIAPLLVLAAVLLLGFAGCSFEAGFFNRTLTFRAKVPAELEVVGGVKFMWLVPGATVEEEATATSPGPTPSVDRYVDAAVALGPALMWTLGAVNGLVDRSSNGRNGTALGGVTVGGDANGPTDFADATATLFDGTNDGIGSTYNPFIGTNPRTFVGWARWDSGTATEYSLFGSSAPAPDRPNLRVVVGNRNVIWLPNGNDGQVITWAAAAPGEDTWFMWALRADPGNDKATLFINDSKFPEQPMTDEWPAAPGNFQAALGELDQRPFKGAQGLVAVYERGLTDAELAKLYQVSGDVFWEHKLDFAEKGGWSGRCSMTVRIGAQQVGDDSAEVGFFVQPGSGDHVLVFQAEGSPVGPIPFQVRPIGLDPP